MKQERGSILKDELWAEIKFSFLEDKKQEIMKYVKDVK